MMSVTRAIKSDEKLIKILDTLLGKLTLDVYDNNHILLASKCLGRKDRISEENILTHRPSIPEYEGHGRCIYSDDVFKCIAKRHYKEKRKNYYHGEVLCNKKHQLPKIMRKNKVPDGIIRNHMSGLFGTFVDYMVRFMLKGQLINPNKITAAEKFYQGISGWKQISMRDLKKYYLINNKDVRKLVNHIMYDYEVFTIIRIQPSSILRKSKYFINKGNLDFTQFRFRDLEEYYKEIPRAIAKYNEEKEYTSVISEIWLMSQAEAVLRSSKPHIPDSMNFLDHGEIIGFLENVEKFISKIEFTGKLFGNPILGRKTTIAGDADLMDDTTIYDIKNSKTNPGIAEIRQLLVYAALHYHNKGKLLKRGVIINTVFLAIYEVSFEELNDQSFNLILEHFKGK